MRMTDDFVSWNRRADCAGFHAVTRCGLCLHCVPVYALRLDKLDEPFSKRHVDGSFTSDVNKVLDSMAAKEYLLWVMTSKPSNERWSDVPSCYLYCSCLLWLWPFLCFFFFFFAAVRKDKKNSEEHPPPLCAALKEAIFRRNWKPYLICLFWRQCLFKSVLFSNVMQRYKTATLPQIYGAQPKFWNWGCIFFVRIIFFYVAKKEKNTAQQQSWGVIKSTCFSRLVVKQFSIHFYI